MVEEWLQALGPPRPAHRSPPPEGRLSIDEQPAARLHAALVALGPVFADFGRYLSSRIDLLPRRDCFELAEGEADGHGRDHRDLGEGAEAGAIVREQLDGPSDPFHEIDPVPRSFRRWTHQHHAQLSTSTPVVVRIVRADADRLLGADLPLLPLLRPWLGMPADTLADAIDDFSRTLRQRLDQRQQALALIALAEDAQAGGTLDAPECYADYCARRILTTARVAGATLADAVDRRAAARRLASGWFRQALRGRVVPFDFDLRDVHVRDGRLVLVDGVFEPQTAAERERFLRYLVAVAADDPDAAWDWIEEAAVPGPGAESAHGLRNRLRQAVPFRDGEWSGDDRLGERLLVQWRTVREAGWKMHAHPLHLYRGIQAVSSAATRLAPDRDILLDALQDERLRLRLSDVQRVMDPCELAAHSDLLLQDLLRLPQRLDDFLTLASEGRGRAKPRDADADEVRRTRNRTVVLLASVGALVGAAFLARHLAPAFGVEIDWIGVILLLIVGGWLLAAARV